MPIVRPDQGASVATYGAGDNPQILTANATTGQYVMVAAGTSGTPDPVLQPLEQIARTVSATQAQIDAASGTAGSTGEEQLCGLKITVVGTSANQGQATAAVFVAQNAGSTGAASDDAAGFTAYGISAAGSTGIGIGGAMQGIRRSVAAGSGLTALQLFARNQSGAVSSYNSTGFSGDSGLAIFAFGTDASSDMACGIQVLPIGNGNRFDVGIGFPGVTNGAFTGAIKTATFSDDGNAATSIRIAGTHATAAITVAAGSGAVIIGGTALLSSSDLLEVIAPASTADPLVTFGSAANNNAYSIALRNNSGQGKLAIVASANQFLTNSGAGDMAIFPSATRKVHLGGTSVVYSVKSDNTMGWFNVATVGQYSTTGTSTGFTAGAGTTVTHLSTFTGNTGATAYTIGDIVRLLKLYGLAAA